MNAQIVIPQNKPELIVLCRRVHALKLEGIAKRAGCTTQIEESKQSTHVMLMIFSPIPIDDGKIIPEADTYSPEIIDQDPHLGRLSSIL